MAAITPSAGMVPLSGDSPLRASTGAYPSFAAASLTPTAGYDMPLNISGEAPNTPTVVTYMAYGPEGRPVPGKGSIAWISDKTRPIARTEFSEVQLADTQYIDYRMAKIFQDAGQAPPAADPARPAYENGIVDALHALFAEWSIVGVVAEVGAPPRRDGLRHSRMVGVCVQNGPIEMLNIFPDTMVGAVRLGLMAMMVSATYEFRTGSGDADVLTTGSIVPRILQLVPVVRRANEDPTPSEAELIAAVDGQAALQAWFPIGDLDTNDRSPAAPAGARYNAGLAGRDMLRVTLVDRL